MTKTCNLLTATLSTALAASTGFAVAQADQKGFDSMAQPSEDQIECKTPRPPRDLAETAYIRNGYRAILRIMAAEKWQETGSCECVISTISWDDVVARSEEFVTSENPRLPFDVVALDNKASALEGARDADCASE